MSDEAPALESVMAGELWYASRPGFADRVAPLLRVVAGRAQALVFTSEAALEAFRAASGVAFDAVRLNAGDWRAREGFLAGLAALGAFEFVVDHGPESAGWVFRTGAALLEVESHKTLTACLA